MKAAAFFLWIVMLGGMAFLSLVPHLLYTPGHADKFLHAATYCLLITWPAAMFKSGRRVMATAIALAALGGLIEILQGIIGGRESSIYDEMANCGGILYGLIAGSLIRRGLRAVPKTDQREYPPEYFDLPAENDAAQINDAGRRG